MGSPNQYICCMIFTFHRVRRLKRRNNQHVLQLYFKNIKDLIRELTRAMPLFWTIFMGYSCHFDQKFLGIYK